MKRIISLSLILFFSATLFFSCSKKGETQSPKLPAQAMMSTAEYLQFMDSVRPSKNYKFTSIGSQVLADVLGGLGGVGSGEWIVGGPLAPAAATFCFFIGAAAGSGMLGIQLIETGKPPLIVAPCPTCNTNVFGNSKNPYDYVGLCHNQVLYAVFSSPQTYEASGGNLNVTAFYNLAATTFSKNQGISIEQLNEYYPVSYFSSYDSLLLNCTAQYGSIPNYLQSTLSSNPAADAFVVSALQNYIKAINGFNDYTSFYNYSVQVENALLNTNASATDKQFLLSSYAVGRYSAGFWLNSTK